MSSRHSLGRDCRQSQRPRRQTRQFDLASAQGPHRNMAAGKLSGLPDNQERRGFVLPPDFRPLDLPLPGRIRLTTSCVPFRTGFVPDVALEGGHQVSASESGSCPARPRSMTQTVSDCFKRSRLWWWFRATYHARCQSKMLF